MESAHRRPKRPELVRRGLLDQAAAIALADGLGAVTMQAVASAAGVTKGGFLHHFPHKQGLLDAVFADLLEGFERELDARMAADPEPRGAFTRAYVAVVMDAGWSDAASPRASLSVLMLSDARLRDLWAGWFNARLARHAATDGGPDLAVVRLAADGFWLGELARIDLPERDELRRRLVDATRVAP